MSDKPWPKEWCSPVLTAVDLGSPDGDVTVKYLYDNDTIYILDLIRHYPAPNSLYGDYINQDGDAV